MVSYSAHSLAEVLAIAQIHPFYASDVEYPPGADTLQTIRSQSSEEIADLNDLQQRPLLWKKDLYATIQSLINDTNPKNTFRRGIYTSITGGGGGPNPLFFATDVHENRRHRANFGLFIRSIGLVTDSDWVVTVHTGGGLYRSLDLTLELLENAGASVLSAGSYMKPEVVVQLLIQYHANVLSGDSSQVVQIVHYISTLADDQRSGICISKIIYTSEGLTPSQRGYILAVLGPVQIFSILGSAEAGPYAVSGSHLLDGDDDVADQQSFVFDTRHTIIEILPFVTPDDQDPRPTPLQDGEVGVIAQTSLSRLRNPLVRYITGDVGSLHPLPKAAKNKVPLDDWEHLRILHLQGRDRRFSFQWDGDYFEFNGLNDIMSETSHGVLQWQVILDKEETSQDVILEVRLLPSSHIKALGEFRTALEDHVRSFLRVDAQNEDRFRFVSVRDLTDFVVSSTGKKVIKFVNRIE